MNCYFCQSSMKESADWSFPNQRRFDCPSCPYETRRVCYTEKGTGIISFEVAVFKYQKYTLAFVLPNDHVASAGKKFHLSTYDGSVHTILRLDYLPKISPYNVEKKLPTLLTFL